MLLSNASQTLRVQSANSCIILLPLLFLLFQRTSLIFCYSTCFRCSYEHAVYVLDAFIYSITHWPRAGTGLDRSISVSSHDGEDSGPSSSQPSQHEDTSGLETRPSPNAESKRRRRHSHEREAVLKFFGMDVIHIDREKFLSSLQDTLQQKFPKVPKASWEVFTHNVTMSRQKSSDDSNLVLQRENDEESGLPTTFSTMST